MLFYGKRLLLQWVNKISGLRPSISLIVVLVYLLYNYTLQSIRQWRDAQFKVKDLKKFSRALFILLINIWATFFEWSPF